MPIADESAIRARLSAERLAPYVDIMGVGPGRALGLYAWNVEMSSAFFEEIHYLEIVLRNALHLQLAAINRLDRVDGAWYERREWFTEEALADLDRARSRVVKAGRDISAGPMLTELSFGFWRYLLTARYHRLLWEPGLRLAFPNLSSAMDRRKEVDALVHQVYLLRNRIAHHEPILRRDLIADHDAITQLLEWICVDTRSWVEVRSRVLRLTASRPYA